MDPSNLALVLSALGIGGVIGAFVTHWLTRRKEIEFKERELKVKRYKSILLFMDAYIEPKNITYLSQIHPALENERDTKEWLKAEYRELILYSSKEVVLATKNFIEKPSYKAFSIAMIAMRNDLHGKKQDIIASEITLKS